VKKHRTDGVSLVFGVVFLLVAIWLIFGRTVHIGLGTLAWVTAVALISIGGVGLLGALRGRDTDQNRDRR
jgi:low affinity Fe/Cu permease